MKMYKLIKPNVPHTKYQSLKLCTIYEREILQLKHSRGKLIRQHRQITQTGMNESKLHG